MWVGGGEWRTQFLSIEVLFKKSSFLPLWCLHKSVDSNSHIQAVEGLVGFLSSQVFPGTTYCQDWLAAPSTLTPPLWFLKTISVRASPILIDLSHLANVNFPFLSHHPCQRMTGSSSCHSTATALFNCSPLPTQRHGEKYAQIQIGPLFQAPASFSFSWCGLCLAHQIRVQTTVQKWMPASFHCTLIYYPPCNLQ